MTGSASNPAPLQFAAEPRMRFGRTRTAGTAAALDLVHTLGRSRHRKIDPPIHTEYFRTHQKLVLERRDWVEEMCALQDVQKDTLQTRSQREKIVIGVTDGS